MGSEFQPKEIELAQFRGRPFYLAYQSPDQLTQGQRRAFKFDGPVKADLGANYTVLMSDRVSMRFYGKVENIFDREYLESGFRTPGAGFTGGLGLRF